ncbi:hypothetical protein ACJX0J_018207, partial [Zea mays]
MDVHYTVKNVRSPNGFCIISAYLKHFEGGILIHQSTYTQKAYPAKTPMIGREEGEEVLGAEYPDQGHLP